MTALSRVVADTNVLVSQLILPQSLPARALEKVELQSLLLMSEVTMYELADVLSRRKFDRYVSRDDRKGFLLKLGAIAEFVPIVQVVRECRDPKDDKFLEVAVNGRAEAIISGDADLLAMHPWHEIAILSPSEYLAR